MFQIDEQIEYSRVQQFATQIQNIAPELRDEYESHFSNKESDDFYLGLLAGYANAYVLATSDELDADEKKQYLGALVAFVADKMASRGL